MGKKVLRIINRLNLGGPTYNAAYLSKYLAPEFETLLVSGMKDDIEESSEFIVKEMGLNPIYIPEMRREISPINDYIAYKKIKKIIQEFKPDIVHTHAAKAGTLGRLAASACKVPVIIHTFHGHVFHSYFNPVKTKLFIEIERYLAKKSSKIIAISEKQKEEIGSIFKICDVSKIEVIPLGFDLSRFQEKKEEKRNNFRKEYLLEDDEIAIGIIGRIVPIKNHELFLRALKVVLNNTTKKVRAFIIGDGGDRLKIEVLAKELQIDFINFTKTKNKASLTFTSWIKEIDGVIAGMDIIALTSLNEGTPVSLIEAQAANKPIVTTKVGGIENIVIPNETALLSENSTAEDFSQKLLTLVEYPNLRMGMGKKGWDHVKEKFHYTRLVKDIKRLYNIS